MRVSEGLFGFIVYGKLGLYVSPVLGLDIPKQIKILKSIFLFDVMWWM